MVRAGASERVFELPSGRRITIPVDDGGFRTREIRRPCRDQTVELGEGDLEVLFQAPSARRTAPAGPPSPEALWSLEGVVEEELAIDVEVDEDPEPRPLGPSRRGLLWRLMFRLGWVRDERLPLSVGF